MLIVTCAIIEKEGKVLLVQRNAQQKLAHKWEFPGGKIEPGESYPDCIKREIQEELGVDIAIIEQLDSAPIGNVGILVPFRCTISRGEITLLEHQAQRWLLPEEIIHMDLSEADIPIAKAYVDKLRQA